MDIIIPPKRKPNSDSGYFEILSKAVFQAGFSWKIVERKWVPIREAFETSYPDEIKAKALALLKKHGL